MLAGDSVAFVMNVSIAAALTVAPLLSTCVPSVLLRYTALAHGAA